MKHVSVCDYPQEKVKEDTHCEVCGCKVPAGLYVGDVDGVMVCTSTCALVAVYNDSGRTEHPEIYDIELDEEISYARQREIGVIRELRKIRDSVKEAGKTRRDVMDAIRLRRRVKELRKRRRGLIAQLKEGQEVSNIAYVVNMLGRTLKPNTP